MVRQDSARSGRAEVALDWRRVAAAVQGQRIGRRLVFQERTGSTNDDARRLAEKGESEGLVVVADEQTAGRGRVGKSPWLTPPRTALAVSVLLRPALPPARLGVLSMLAGVAVVEALSAVAGVPAGLKWPNDVLVRGKKVAGILVESSIGGEAVEHVVVGIGINVNMRATDLGPLPDSAIAPTTLLDETGDRVSREALLIALLQRIETEYAVARAGAADDVVARYRKALAMLGQRVWVVGAGSSVEGLAETVTESGELVLRLDDGRRAVFGYGEVTLRQLE